MNPIEDWATLNAIEQSHGDSFFLIDLEEFRRNFESLRDAFQSFYPNTLLAYSYKTNYLPRLCRLADELGGYAEVVSRMEYEIARKIGVPAERIIFNGPYKAPGDMRTAILDGATVNIDSLYQVEALESLQLEVEACIGVRCNFELEGGGISRFGFDAEGPELRQMIERLRLIPGVSIVGLHCHFSVPGRRPGGYRAIAERMVALAKEFFQDDPPRFIDIGGGYFGSMPAVLAEQFGGNVPSFEDYAAAVGPVIAEAWPEGTPQLILEPGVSVAATCGRLVTRVLEVRPIRDRWFALVSSSVQVVQPTRSPLNLPVQIIRAGDRRQPGHSAGVDVVGYTCMENDVIFSGLTEDVAAGDYLVFQNCGAYTNVQKMPFIRAAPPMLSLTADGQIGEILRRGETTSDILATYGV